MALSGSRRGMRKAVRLLLDLRWIGVKRRRRGRRTVEVGASFAPLAPAPRARIGDILRFDDFRPGIRLLRLLPASAAAPRRPRR